MSDYDRDDRCDDEANEGLALAQACERARLHGVPFRYELEADDDE
jgi:hypothetical protein